MVAKAENERAKLVDEEELGGGAHSAVTHQNPYMGSEEGELGVDLEDPDERRR